MRTTTLLLAFIVSVSGVAAAQEFSEFVSTRDGFKITFPDQPKVVETTWKTQQGYSMPARVYSVDQGAHYSVTVVDYNGIEKVAIEHVKTCPPGARPLCLGTDVSGPGLWKHDTREAVLFESMKMIQRGGKLTDLTWSQHDLVEGNELQLLNPDQSRTYAYIAMHEMKLYIVEATVPKGYPPATLFQTSMGWVDKDGNGIRYQTIYENGFHGLRVYPVPPHAGGAGAAAAGAQGRGAAAGR